jgi:hypothetical protein
VACPAAERFLAFATGIESFEVRDRAKLEQRISEADVLVISGRASGCDSLSSRCWHRPVLARALKQHGVRLASGRRVNPSAARASL